MDDGLKVSIKDEIKIKEIENELESKVKIFTLISKLFNELSYFSNKDYGNIENYDIEYLNWIVEVLTKNRFLHYKQYNESKFLEKIKRERGKVYRIDFGINIGSEFNYPHFCVVVKEFENTAIVIPLSSVKEDKSSWKNEDNFIVKVGYIVGLPRQERSSYALINQIQTVSKKRLDVYKDSMDKYITLKLNSNQMNIIDEQLIKLCKNNNLDIIPYCNDYY